jgi:threonyl-tRNA synthetase
MPQRFELRYVDAGGERRHLVMLHRALYGSLERFLGLLLEHHGAALPAWLAPEQVAIVPIGAAHRARAAEVLGELERAGVRARVDAGDDTLARRVAIAHHDGVPFVAVIGDRELAGGTLSVRARDGAFTSADAVAELARRCQAPG